MKTVWLYFCLAVGLLLGGWLSLPPSPVSSGAPAEHFSAERAMSDVRAMARQPHPVGTAEHDRVAAYLTARLQQMGLQPETSDDMALFRPGHLFVSAAQVHNIIAVLPGTNHQLAALALVAHYDSVPHSPGAADDAAGVATVLETVRALQSASGRQRDVLLVLTDGEEHGMLGAEAFFHRHPLAKRVGAVLNFDTRGTDGQAVMYETGPQSGLLVQYLAGARRFSAHSLASRISDAMPNGTDFLFAKAQGLPGLNFAFIGDEAGYHSALATADRLNPGSVQHMGEQALAVARAAVMNSGALTQDNEVYGDIFGRFLIHYPPLTGWVLLGIIALTLLFAFGRGRASDGADVMRGLFAGPLLLLVPALLLWPVGHLLSGLSHFQRIPMFPCLVAGGICLTVGTSAYIGQALRTGRGSWVLVLTALIVGILSSLGGFDPVVLGLMLGVMVLAPIAIGAPLSCADIWRGTLLFAFFVGLALQTFLPEAAPVIVWPLLVASLCAAMTYATANGRNSRPGVYILLGLVVIAALAQYTPLCRELFEGLALDLPAIMVVPLLILLPVLTPVLTAAGTERSAAELAWLLGLGGVVLIAVAWWTSPSPDRPAPAMVMAVQDLNNGKAWRAAPMAHLDPWAKTALESDGDSARYTTLAGLFDHPVWLARAKVAEGTKAPVPPLSITRAHGRLTLNASPAPGDTALELSVYSSRPLSASYLNGQRLEGSIAPGQWTRIRFDAPPKDGVIWSFANPTHAHIAVRLTTISPHWAQGMTAPAPKSAEYTDFGDDGTSRRTRVISAQW